MAEQSQQRTKVTENPPPPVSGFDKRTHIKDENTGRLIRKQIHSLHVVGGQYLYEYPVKSGNLFFENGDVAGRWVRKSEKSTEFKHEPDATHIEFAAPRTELVTPEAVFDENEMLRAEIAALKAEREKNAKTEIKKDTGAQKA